MHGKWGVGGPELELGVIVTYTKSRVALVDMLQIDIWDKTILKE